MQIQVGILVLPPLILTVLIFISSVFHAQYCSNIQSCSFEHVKGFITFEPMILILVCCRLRFLVSMSIKQALLGQLVVCH